VTNLLRKAFDEAFLKSAGTLSARNSGPASIAFGTC
jgi:hypothetical protein